MLYAKLAYNNLKKNRTIYLPFGLATIFTVILNIVMQVILHNEGINSMPQADIVRSLFGFGSVVIMIFSIVFTLYTHSFLIKRRKKELGLYNILGMDKGNLTKMMLLENFYLFLIILISGTLSGMIFSKLLFLILKKLTGLGEGFVFDLSISSLIGVAGLFLGIFFLTFCYDVWEVRKTKPIELLGQSKSGEKEPKAEWVFSTIGLGALLAGYVISIKIQSPLQAINLFFIAVILVIIGTYSLFIAGSVTLLKFLKNRKKFYYKPSNFIAVSSMTFRMKQNGAGLATICILCTMALVTISTTVSLYFGQEDMIQNSNPFQQSIDSNLPANEVEDIVKKTAQSYDRTIKNLSFMDQTFHVVGSKEEEEVFQPVTNAISDYGKLASVQFISQSEYNRIEQKQVQLTGEDILLYPFFGNYRKKEMQLGSQHFVVKEVLSAFSLVPKADETAMNSFLMVVPDERIDSLFDTLRNEFETGVFSFPIQKGSKVFFEMDGAAEQRLAVVNELKDVLSAMEQQADSEVFVTEITSIDQARIDNQVMSGGFLFIGLIFGISFIIATALIIFYKQVSEGNDDRDRFIIMQKVGLSHKEVHRTIHHQILMVFFLPIVVAVLHLVVAFPIIKKMLVLFGLTNQELLLATTTGCVIIFILAYFLIYWRTSKVYYRLVER